MRSLSRMVMAAGALAGLAVATEPPAAAPRSRVATRSYWRRSSKLNRSSKWDYAETYEEARKLSPFPNRPVR